MIHPDTVIRFLGPDIGHGVLARRPIPAGTLVWVRDARHGSYDARIAAALLRLRAVEQPLLPYLTPQKLDELMRCAETGTGYRSVALRRLR